MVQTNCMRKVFKITIVNASLLLCLFCFSCGDDSNTNTYVIPTASIQLNSLDSWNGIDTFTDDSVGDTSDSGVDIEKVYFTHDNEYFYVRIDIVGIVDNDLDKHLETEVSFFGMEYGYELSFGILHSLSSIDVVRTGNADPPCYYPQQVMSYPGNDFLVSFDHSIVFKVRLSDIDFNIDGTQVTIRTKSNTSEDSTNAKILSMDTTYLSSVTSDWPVPSSNPPYIIPNATISIDGDIADWNGIDPIFTDRIDDVYHTVPSANIQKAYIAQDANAYYFRIDLLEKLVITLDDWNPQVRFEFYDGENSREYWFTAWLNPLEGGLWIQDISIAVDNNPGADIVKEYPVVGYLSVLDRFIEYRVIKSDIGFDLKDGCINLVAVILGVHDFTDSILIE